MKPLSFIIITYNRPDDMLALARNIAGLDRAAELLEEVIILNNASQSNYDALKDFIAIRPDIPFHYLDAPSNLGVARGRNHAIAQGSAPLIIMLDDDAELQNKDCLVNLVRLFDDQDAGRPRAIVSFKVLYYDTLQMQRNALPHKKFDAFKDRHEFLTYYYAGGAHAIRRSVLDKVGNYPEDFFYGMEEYDLGYRILDAGYSIMYSDSVVMLHKESPLGRTTKKEKLRMMWVNKSKVAWRYLPKKYFWSTAAMWSFEYLRKTGFDLGGWFTGWKEALAIPRKEKHTPVSDSTMAYLRKTDARLFY
jgi:GT2 family glycosyltransferase